MRSDFSDFLDIRKVDAAASSKEQKESVDGHLNLVNVAFAFTVLFAFIAFWGVIHDCRYSLPFGSSYLLTVAFRHVRKCDSTASSSSQKKDTLPKTAQNLDSE